MEQGKSAPSIGVVKLQLTEKFWLVEDTVSQTSSEVMSFAQ